MYFQAVPTTCIANINILRNNNNLKKCCVNPNERTTGPLLSVDFLTDDCVLSGTSCSSIDFNQINPGTQGDRIQVRDTRLRTNTSCTSSVGIVTRRDVQFSDIIVLWQSGMNVLIICLSDVTNSEHKSFISNSLTFYFRILAGTRLYSLHSSLYHLCLWRRLRIGDRRILNRIQIFILNCLFQV